MLAFPPGFCHLDWVELFLSGALFLTVHDVGKSFMETVLKCSFEDRNTRITTILAKNTDCRALLQTCMTLGPRNLTITLCALGFPCGSAGKESPWNVGDLSLIPGLERSPGEGNSYPLLYSGLENSIDCIVHGVAKTQTQLSNFQFSVCS